MTATISCRRPIAAPVDAVWAVISGPGNLVEYHPFVAANPVERWPGAGSRDFIEYHNGRAVTRDFVRWEDGAGYDLRVGDGNGPVADVAWRLGGDDPGSHLTITITPRMLGGVPAAVRWIPERALVAPMLRRYLRSVLAGIEWRVTTGDPVRRSQFGSHRWFS